MPLPTTGESTPTDTKKAESLGRCVPDKPPEFTKAACTSETMAKANTTDGKDIPLASKVSCFTSEKVTCQVFRNATNHTFVAAQCTEAAKKASTAQASSTWCIHTYLLMALLLVSHVSLFDRVWMLRGQGGCLDTVTAAWW